MAKRKKSGENDAGAKPRGKKDSQLLIRIAGDERDAFLRLCEQLDTTAAREIRRFIREFRAAHGDVATGGVDGRKEEGQ